MELAAVRSGKTLGGILLAAVTLLACGEEGSGAADASAAATTDGGGFGEAAVDGGLCACSGSACDETVEITSAQHVPGLVLEGDPPPAGGRHDPCWADYGVYSDALPAANWVHNLEHGAVVLLYHCPDGCDEEAAVLAEFTQDHPRTLLTPYPSMSTRFAVVSWGHRMRMDCLDVRGVQAFYDAHFDRAPESVASGKPAACP